MPKVLGAVSAFEGKDEGREEKNAICKPQCDNE